MAITEEEKQAYNDLIQNLYDGSLNSSPEMISQEVIDIVNTILTEAIECSKAIAITEELINLLFPSGTLGRLTKDIVTSGLQAIFNWIDAIFREIGYTVFALHRQSSTGNLHYN